MLQVLSGLAGCQEILINQYYIKESIMGTYSSMKNQGTKSRSLPEYTNYHCISLTSLGIFPFQPSPAFVQQHQESIHRVELCQKHSTNNHTLILWVLWTDGVDVCVLYAQLCPTLCDPMVCSPQAPPFMEILQGRILEWIAIPCSRGSSQRRD